MEEIINTSTLQTLTLLSILGVLLSQTSDQMHNALNNEPIRQKNLRSASIFFILATFVSIVLIPLTALVIILGRSIPILLEKSAWYSPDQLPYYIILLPAIFLSIGAVKFFDGLQIAKKFQGEMIELQEILVLQMIEGLDKKDDGVTRERLKSIMSKTAEKLVKYNLARFLDNSKIAGGIKPYINSILSIIGAQKLYELVVMFVPSAEQLDHVVDVLVKDSEIIETNNGYLVSKNHLEHHLKVSKKVSLLESRGWSLKKKKDYTWLEKKNKTRASDKEIVPVS